MAFRTDSLQMDRRHLHILQSDHDNENNWNTNIIVADETNSCFLFRLGHQNEHESGIFSVTIEEDLIIPRRQYFERATSITRYMVDCLNVDPAHVGSYVSEIRSTASAMDQNPNFANSRILTLTVIVSTRPGTFYIQQSNVLPTVTRVGPISYDLEETLEEHDLVMTQVEDVLDYHGMITGFEEEIERVISESLGMFRTVPATKSSIEALKEVKADDHEILGSEITVEQCVICLENLWFECIENHDDRVVVRMPCSHLFHKDCIVQWLETNNKCPLCRYAMPS